MAFASEKRKRRAKNRLFVDDNPDDNSSAIAMHGSTMAQLGIFKGDYALVKCKQDREQGRETDRETAVVCVADPSCEEGKARVNGGIRQNLGVQLGDVVSVHKVSSMPRGSKVCILPFVDSVQGITGDLFEGWLMPYFFQAHGSRFIDGEAAGSSAEVRIGSGATVGREGTQEFFKTRDQSVVSGDDEPIVQRGHSAPVYRPVTVNDTFVALGDMRAIEFKVVAVDVCGQAASHCIVGPDTEIYCDGAPLHRRHVVSVRHIAAERADERYVFELPIPDRQITIGSIAQQVFVHENLDGLNGVRVEDVKIVYGGAVLEHGRTLAECRIDAEATILFTYPRPLVDPPSFLNFTSCQTAAHALQAVVHAAAAPAIGFNPLTLCDSTGRTPLHHACMRFADACVASALIAAGAEVNAVDRDGFTPLFFAKSKEVAVQLLLGGADPAHLNNCMQTALHHAASGDIVDALVAHGCVVDPLRHPPRLGVVSALHSARNADVARRLIHHKADVNARTPSGITPLHCAIDVDTAVALLAAKADIHACDNRGRSVLHYAQSPALARLFLSQGVTQRAAADDVPFPPIETVTTFETALVFYEAGEAIPSPALKKRRAGAEEHAESDGRRCLEFQRFNGELALAGLCRSSACIAAFGLRAAHVLRFSSDACRSCFMPLHLSMCISGISAECIASCGEGSAVGGAVGAAAAAAAAVCRGGDAVECAFDRCTALPIFSASELQRLQCAGCAGMAGVLVRRLVGVRARRFATAVAWRVGSSALGLRLHWLETFHSA